VSVTPRRRSQHEWSSIPYLAVVDAARAAADDLLFAAFLALGLDPAIIAVAMLTGREYARWIGQAAALSGAVLLAGDLLVLASDAAFAAVLAGYLLFQVVLAALGASM
jgi:hypothetical protein